MKAGIYYNFDPNAYHADPCPVASLNQSTAKLLLNASPLHAAAAHPRMGGQSRNRDYESDSPMVMGELVHAMVLGRGRRIVRGDFDSYRTKAAQQWKAEAIEQGLLPVLDRQYRQAEKIAQSVGVEVWYDLDRTAPTEVVLIWQEGETWLRSMVDLLDEKNCTVVDLKTTSSAISRDRVDWTVIENGYDIQAAFIERGLNVLMPHLAGRWRFKFVQAEQHQPFGVLPIWLSESTMSFGRRRVEAAVSVWQMCMLSGEWPGYEPVEVTVPDRAIIEWGERELALLQGGAV
ncbi:MAG: hypothetical protein EBZ69_02165 [Alphaproteobacteria bacterium]|nr:hypothetical protein [Alphaproteobacteria bacterium]NDC96262.1 hypothetical protein [bacterium]